MAAVSSGAPPRWQQGLIAMSQDQRIIAVQIEEAERSLGQPAPCLLFVGETAISEAEIAREMQFHPASKPEHSRTEAARALMVRELLRLECERLHIDVDTELQNNETEEEARIRVLLERDIQSSTPTQEDCRRYFEQNRARFCAPDQMRVHHILLSAAPDDAEGRLRARAQAEQWIAELQIHPERFADFALRYSACPSKEQGGDLGWLQRGQTTPEFDRQLFRLPEGLADFPLESRWGYHIARVDAVVQGEPLSFEAVQTTIANYLELQGQQMEIQHYLSALQARHGVRGWEHYDA
ncbi:MAG: peptidylprolyl isomerase [Pseudomonadales bacterium]